MNLLANARQALLLLCLSLSVLGATSACSTPGPKPDPIELAFSESKDSVMAGIDEGFEESESIDQYLVRARLNPCRCEAPRHEIYIHGRWTRVFLEAEETLLAEIDEQLSPGDETVFRSLAITGAIDGRETTAQGIIYQVFEVVSVETDHSGRSGARSSSTSVP